MSKTFSDDQHSQFLRHWMTKDYENNPDYVERKAHDALKIEMEDLQFQISSDYKRIQKNQNVKDDPSVAGTEGEETWLKILSDMLPNFDFKSKVKINLPDGSKSREIDIVMLKKGYPETLSKHYIPHDYVIAAFECKLTFDNKHFKKIIETCSTIKQAFNRTGTPYKELNSPIIYGVLAHSSNYMSPQKALHGIVRKMKEHTDLIEHPSHLVDFFLIADSLSCSASKSISFEIDTDIGTIFCGYNHCLQWSKEFNDVPVTWDHPANNIVGTFFYELFRKLAKEYPYQHFGFNTFSYFHPTRVVGVKDWNVDTLSEELLLKVKDPSFQFSAYTADVWSSVQ